MPRMIDQIRQSAVSANLMRTASKGALDVPSHETIEILVYLATHPIFGEDASLTLATWNESACREVCSNPETPKEVLDYFLHNRRPRLMTTLLENPAIPESALLDMAQEQSAESVQLLLATARARASRDVLETLSSNPVLTASQTAHVRQLLEQIKQAPAAEAAPDEADATLAQFVAEHAEEIAAEEGKNFELVGGPEAEEEPNEVAVGDEAAAEIEAATEVEPVAEVAPAPRKKPTPKDLSRMSPLQKISGLTVGERVQLAIKGSREERYILVRDGSKVVSSAVLESPKVTEQEIEAFASMKNVQESVLRAISCKRKFMKIYAVQRALVNNPKCPLDVQLTLMKNLLNTDLRSLSKNKNISETLRRVATKLFHDRTDKK